MFFNYCMHTNTHRDLGGYYTQVEQQILSYKWNKQSKRQ